MFRLSEIKKTRSYFYHSLPVTDLETVDDYNAAIDYFKSNGYSYGIPLTKNRNISTRGHLSFSYEIISYHGSMAGWQIWCVTPEGNFILQFTPTMDKDGQIVGRTNKKGGTYALNRFACELQKQSNITLLDYALPEEEAIAVKSSIPKALIGPVDDDLIARTLEHCYHLDINSAYPAGLKEAFPEFGKVIDYLYTKKKNAKTEEEKDDYKLILNSLIGKMQSETIQYRYAHMSKAAITYCKAKILQMAYWLRQHDCKVVMYNTDGLWFYPNRQLPDLSEFLGSELGQWKLDHKDCTLCMKNANYEFIEDGKYTPVVRGKTKLDRIKPRSQWQWGDIFKFDASEILKIVEDVETHKLIWVTEDEINVKKG